MNFTHFLKKLEGMAMICWGNIAASLFIRVCALQLSPTEMLLLPTLRPSVCWHFSSCRLHSDVNCPCRHVGLLSSCCKYLFSSVISKLLKSSQIVLPFVPSNTYTVSLGHASSTPSTELSCLLPVPLDGNRAHATLHKSSFYIYFLASQLY